MIRPPLLTSSTKLWLGVLLMATLNCQADNTGKGVRRPAVAGQFYSGSAGALRRDVNEFLADGARLDSPPRMLISPHAGYVYSGPVAGKGFSAIDKSITTVILVGPSHRVRLEGLSVPDVQSYETPLGNVPLNAKIISKLLASPIVTSVPMAHSAEHCLEVQIPFLQVLLPSFTIVPIVTGRVDPAAAAELIQPHVGSQTLVVASSDLSHFYSHKQAKKIDALSIETILSGDADGDIDGCGETAIRVVMHLARTFKLKPVLLDARNSYETAPHLGGPNRVVGYVSIAYVAAQSGAGKPKAEPAAAEQAGSAEPSAEVKQYLLKLARESLERSVRGEPLPKTDDAPGETRENSGCFVTLKKKGVLRGCVGVIEPVMPLCEAVVENARKAALSDSRFPVVVPAELKDIKVEVSILTPPENVEYTSPDDLLGKLRPGVDGIILKKDWHQSTFLPQVWEQLPDKVMFLERLSRKGGMPADGWKSATVKRYQAIHFEEH